MTMMPVEPILALALLATPLPIVRIDSPEPISCLSADEMRDAVATSGVFLQMGFMRRFDAGYAAAKKQIDAGRIGGITTAHDVRLLAAAQGIRYVNHTFKSHLSLAAALHVFASSEDFDLCEYPAGGSELSRKLVRNPITRQKDGLVATPSEPGLGVEIDLDIVRRFLKPVRIEVGGGVIHETPPP